MRLTRVELIDLYVRITNALPDMPEGSESRQIALINLRDIRIVLARHDLTPQHATPCRCKPAGLVAPYANLTGSTTSSALSSRRHDLRSVASVRKRVVADVVQLSGRPWPALRCPSSVHASRKYRIAYMRISAVSDSPVGLSRAIAANSWFAVCPSRAAISARASASSSEQRRLVRRPPTRITRWTAFLADFFFVEEERGIWCE
jgi:hypothetical protein